MIYAEKKTIAHTLLFAGLLVLSLNYVLYWVLGFEALRMPVRVSAIAMFALSLAFNFKALRFDILYIPMLGLATLSFLLHGTDALNMLAVLLFVLAASPYSLEVLLADLLKCFAVALLLYLASIALGRAAIVTHTYGGRTRNYLGFSHVNAAALFFLPLLLLLAMKFKRKKVLFCFVVLSFVVLYALTNTRSVLFAVGAFLLGYALFVAMGKAKALTHFRGVFGLIVLYALLGAAFTLSLFAGTNIDVALSYRPTLFHEASASFTPLDWLFGSSAFKEVDNSFIVIVGHYGLIFLAFAVAVLHKSILRCAKTGDAWSYAFILSIVATGSFESFLYRPELIGTLAFWIIVFGYARPNVPIDSRNEATHV